MSVALASTEPSRTSRLTALVSAREAEQIARLAAAAGLSVSAYLRDRALGASASQDDAAVLSELDKLIDRMESDLDSAVTDLTATLARIDAA